MPIGPFSTFSDCVTAQQNKGNSAEAARAICGKMQKQIEGSVKAEVFTDVSNSRYYVKAFLVDDSLNINRWQVTKESIERNINTFIGRPLVLTENFDHPGADLETLNHWLAYQESFRVGTIIDITTKPNPSIPDSTVYYAIIEVTDPDLKQALRDNTVPLYVSPALAEPLPLGASYTELPPRRVSEHWVGVHLAIVDEPAFGVRKAVISDQCGGSEQACLLQLRKAHIEKYGIGRCGFCVKKALNRYQILRKLANNEPISTAADNGSSVNTSHTFRTASVPTEGNYRKMSQLESINNNDSTGSNDNNNSNKQDVNVSPERVERFERPVTTKQPVQTNVPPIPPPASSNTNISDLYAEIQNLRHENQLKDLKIEELTSITDTYNQRIANLETEKRIERIQAIITPDVIKDERERLEKIKYLVASAIPIEHIEELYKGVKIQLRKASVNNHYSRSGRVPYYSGTPLGTGTVASIGSTSGSASNIATAVIVDEETGLTPLQKQLAVLRGGP